MKFAGCVSTPLTAWMVLLAGVTMPLVVGADDACVRFDVPSAIESCEVTDGQPLPHQRLVDIVIPISSLVGCRQDQQVLELLIQVRGLGNGIQVVDYAPRTRLYSEIEGTVAVEQHRERTSSLGLHANGSAYEMAGLDANANLGSSSGNRERYERIPEQKLLLASGTISRGSGAYFKFRHSPQTTLEGGHEIMLTLRVPATWRGGMLRVDCLATGKEKFLLREGDFRAGQASFVIATWLKGDGQAQQTVQQYSALESRIRGFARSLQNRDTQSAEKAAWGQFFGNQGSPLPDNWASQFALYDSRSIQGQIKPFLPQGMQETADQFLVSRRHVLNLAR